MCQSSGLTMEDIGFYLFMEEQEKQKAKAAEESEEDSDDE